LLPGSGASRVQHEQELSMSIMDTIKGGKLSAPAAKPAQMTAPTVAQKLRTAEMQLEAQEAKCAQLAYEVAIGEVSETALTSENSLLPGLRQQVEQLRAALAIAERHDEKTVAAQRVSIRKTQLAAVRKHLEARNAAAVALSEAIAEAAKQYRELVARTEKAIAATPIGSEWPSRREYSSFILRRLVSNEVFRLSATAGDKDNLSLPGSEAPDIQHKWAPDKVTPLADKIADQSKFALAHLTGSTE
jgi:hypothetical protein